MKIRPQSRHSHRAVKAAEEGADVEGADVEWSSATCCARARLAFLISPSNIRLQPVSRHRPGAVGTDFDEAVVEVGRRAALVRRRPASTPAQADLLEHGVVALRSLDLQGEAVCSWLQKRREAKRVEARGRLDTLDDLRLDRHRCEKPWQVCREGMSGSEYVTNARRPLCRCFRPLWLRRRTCTQSRRSPSMTLQKNVKSRHKKPWTWLSHPLPLTTSPGRVPP